MTYNAENRRRANKSLLASLEAMWDEVPEWRFGQLVMNLSRDHSESGFANTWNWSNADWNDRITTLYHQTLATDPVASKIEGSGL